MRDDGHGQAGDERQSLREQFLGDTSTRASLVTDFYRAEIDRTTAWRSRLDQTTNWAVVLVAAVLTWSFSSTDHPHYVIIIGMLGVTAFLVMEANRYREYDIWRNRVRVLQEELLASAFDPATDEDADWPARLATDLRSPAFSMSRWNALAHRLRRSYLALQLVLLAAWFARVTVFEASEPWQETASILTVPGELVVAVIGTFYAVLLVITAVSARGGTVREFEA